MTFSELIAALRNNPSTHLGLGDIRLSFAQQEDILAAIPYDVAEKFRQWKKEHPNEDYQLDEILEFSSSLSRDEILRTLEFIAIFA